MGRREPEDPQTLAACESFRLTPRVQNDLEKIIRTIKGVIDSVQLKQGRPKADQHKLAKTIAELFREHLGKEPSSTKEGPFESVVRIAFNALDVEIKDPARSVKSALKK